METLNVRKGADAWNNIVTLSTSSSACISCPALQSGRSKCDYEAASAVLIAVSSQAIQTCQSRLAAKRNISRASLWLSPLSDTWVFGGSPLGAPQEVADLSKKFGNFYFFFHFLTLLHLQMPLWNDQIILTRLVLDRRKGPLSVDRNMHVRSCV